MAEVVPLPRGVIRCREAARQIVDFRDLCFGRITPTDVDGLIEYKDRCYLLLELKHSSRPDMERGQELAFERMADDCAKPFLLLHAVHDVPAQQDINAARATVHRYYWRGRWRAPPEPMTVREAAKGFFEKYGTPG